MITLKLKTVHRFQLRNLLNGEAKAGHSLSDLNQINKIFDKVTFTDDEVKLLNIRTENVPGKDTNGQDVTYTSFLWNTHEKPNGKGKELDIEKDFEISDEQKTLLTAIIERKNTAKEFTMDQVRMMDIAEQLGIKI